MWSNSFRGKWPMSGVGYWIFPEPTGIAGVVDMREEMPGCVDLLPAVLPG
jgi:hypothetical protein